MKNLEDTIHQIWDEDHRSNNYKSDSIKSIIENVINDLDAGRLRVVEFIDGIWVVNQWIKKAIVLSFKLRGHQVTDNHGTAYDKVPSKFTGWTADHFTQHNIRVVPGAVVRHGCFIGDNTVIMPSFINIGASVGHNTMIDTWATVGSCAHVGSHCHISGGTGLGGVLEPLQGRPVIIEDNCFIGARSEIVEGVIVRQGAVIGMGVFIGSNTPIFDLLTGQITYNEVPPYSVVIAGSLPSKKTAPNGITPNLNCAVIIKKVDAQTRRKTAINELLRN